jgi:3-oxoacyl-(acyl-carrier-protein) synthase
MNARPYVRGIGVMTGEFPTARSLLRAVAPAHPWRALAENVAPIAPAELAVQDCLGQIAFTITHEALAMAGLDRRQDTALLLVTGWGTVDATVAYLESMLDQDGRFASPRHFSRSVHSSIASLLAIKFGLQGPCETLAFDDRAVDFALERAELLLSMERAEQVVVCWADQTAPILEELVRRGVEELGRKQYARYLRAGLGQGGAAMVLSRARGTSGLILPAGGMLPEIALDLRPFPLDVSVRAVAALLAGTCGAGTTSEL